MKLLAFVIGLCFILGCSSVRIKQSDFSASLQTTTTVAEKSEVFDTTKLHKTKEKRIVIGGDTINPQNQLRVYIEQIKEKGLREFVQAGYHMPINEYNYSSTSDFYDFKQFYSNGILKQKGSRCCYGFYIGKWYYYDNKGKLINTANFDADYAFTWEDVLKLCLKRNIPLNKTTAGPATTIYKKTIKGKKLWIVTYPDFNKEEYITLMLDAYDGNVMGKKRSPFPII